MCAHMCAYVVCVCEEERKRERESWGRGKGRGGYKKCHYLVVGGVFRGCEWLNSFGNDMDPAGCAELSQAS